MTAKQVSVIFWIVSLAHLIAIVVGWLPGIAATKPLLMPILMWWFFQATAANRTKPHKIFLAGLLFSWFGDLFLMFVSQNELFFLAGLGSFLITHILYVIAFKNDSLQGSSPRILTRKPHLGSPLLLLFMALMWVLFPNIPADMKIPVIVYASVITLMTLAALNRHGRIGNNSFKLVLIGAVVFMLSDSTIAINKFIYDGELWGASFVIMLLYISGQSLIAKGLVNTTE